MLTATDSVVEKCMRWTHFGVWNTSVEAAGVVFVTLFVVSAVLQILVVDSRNGYRTLNREIDSMLVRI